MAYPETWSTSDMLARVRARANMESGGTTATIATSAEILDLIYASMSQLYEMLVDMWGHEHFAETLAFTAQNDIACSAGTATALDLSQVYRLLSVELLNGTKYVPLLDWEYGDRDRLTPYLGTPYTCNMPRFRFVKNRIQFEPPDASDGMTGRIVYVPYSGFTSSGGTTFSWGADWHWISEWAVWDVAYQLKIKEGWDDPAWYARRRDELTDRIQKAASKKSATGPSRFVRRGGW